MILLMHVFCLLEESSYLVEFFSSGIFKESGHGMAIAYMISNHDLDWRFSKRKISMAFERMRLHEGWLGQGKIVVGWFSHCTLQNLVLRLTTLTELS